MLQTVIENVENVLLIVFVAKVGPKAPKVDDLTHRARTVDGWMDGWM